MGLKNWLAKNAGASGYGEVMGREAVKNGLVLGRTLYLGHGTRVKTSDDFVFDDINHLQSEGYELYCPDVLHRPPMEDSSDLSRHTRASGIAFAVQCSMMAARNFMREQNASAFNRSMGSANKEELQKLVSGVTADLVLKYLKLMPVGTQLLNLKRPGSSDILAVFLQELSKQSPEGAVAFQRTGVLGFDVIAVSLAEETVKAISAAAQKFGW